MEPYRVGALADLISSSSKNEDGAKKKSKKKASLGDLFVSKLPAVPATVKPANEEPKPAKKRKAEKPGGKTESDENELPAKKKSKKASKPTAKEFSDDEEDSKEFTKPSLKYQVRLSLQQDNLLKRYKVKPQFYCYSTSLGSSRGLKGQNPRRREGGAHRFRWQSSGHDDREVHQEDVQRVWGG